ncbi:hypothetical protein PRIPAC_70599 [Pristionchus pacificus]|nr:hypothetical protein PRIPAC_70599 [Pristionchus pacificus]
MKSFNARVEEQQRRKRGLNAVYMLTGERKDRDDSHRDAIILVRETDLERTKNGFERVDECTLFSLQCMHIEELHTLLSADIVDNEEYLDGDQDRIGIAFTEHPVHFTDEDIAKEVKKKAINSFDVIKASAAGRKDIGQFKRDQEEKQRKKEEAEHNRLEMLFQKACDRPKTPKSSPKKVPASPFSSGKKREEKEDEETSNSPVVQRKRQRKIMLDNESDGEEECASPKESEVKKRKEEKKEEKKRETRGDKKKDEEKKKKRATIESDDDLFDTADDSPVKKDIKEEEMDVDEEEEKPSRKKGKKEEKRGEKTRTLEESGGLRRSPRKQAETPSGPSKRFVQKDVTFVDKDGMMGTRREMVEVEITEEERAREKREEEAKRKPLEAAKKGNVPGPAKNTSAKGAAKKPVAGQSKISAFFTKK